MADRFFDQNADLYASVNVELPLNDAPDYARLASVYFGIVCDVTYSWRHAIVEMCGARENFEMFSGYLTEVGYTGVKKAW